MSLELLQELDKRSQLIKCIDGIIATCYSPNPRIRLKRGQVQNHIFNILILTKNNLLCKIVTDRMAAAGFETITNSGNQYYRHKDYKFTHQSSS